MPSRPRYMGSVPTPSMARYRVGPPSICEITGSRAGLFSRRRTDPLRRAACSTVSSANRTIGTGGHGDDLSGLLDGELLREDLDGLDGHLAGHVVADERGEFLGRDAVPADGAAVGQLAPERPGDGLPEDARLEAGDEVRVAVGRLADLARRRRR